jgi:hypothetical protein
MLQIFLVNNQILPENLTLIASLLLSPIGFSSLMPPKTQLNTFHKPHNARLTIYCTTWCGKFGLRQLLGPGTTSPVKVHSKPLIRIEKLPNTISIGSLHHTPQLSFRKKAKIAFSEPIHFISFIYTIPIAFLSRIICQNYRKLQDFYKIMQNSQRQQTYLSSSATRCRLSRHRPKPL